ncbi:MAG: nitrile hydratase subunit beta [Holophagales bacterium]|nr:nitrile hydratase subunit beta [Holophagales bacterium]MYD23084.1 nitrile hydratase subunit beta [Holophagales bacterium]MYI34351.1 nitrile hydratase subunit beta [Holophagales bacterium]
MNGIHDMGGMHGFGAVDRRPDEALFPEAWQGRVCALAGYAIGAGLANLDAFRHAVERMPADRYLADGYYGRWLYALETLAGERLGGDAAVERPDHVGSVVREVDREARFAVGDAVRTWNRHPQGHTRLPGYARDRRGVIAEVHPACVYPDTNAEGRGESPEYLYTVAFDSRELWGEEAEAGATVYIDLFEPYLEVLE